MRGGSKRRGDLGVLPPEKKIQSFQFKCLKWPTLTEITAKYGIYFYFLCQHPPWRKPCIAYGSLMFNMFNMMQYYKCCCVMIQCKLIVEKGKITVKNNYSAKIFLQENLLNLSTENFFFFNLIEIVPTTFSRLHCK